MVLLSPVEQAISACAPHRDYGIHGVFRPSEPRPHVHVHTGHPGIACTIRVTDDSIAVDSINNHDGHGSGVDSYTQYVGDGSHFPSKSEWVSFDDM